MPAKNYMKCSRVSVVIPVYNGAKTLTACLESLLSQSYQPLEIIVVDNNSSDSTKKIIQDFSVKDRRVRYLHESFRSRGAARNKGLDEAVGEFVAMIDADCIAPINWLAELIKPLLSGEELAVTGGQREIITNKLTRKIQESHEEHRQLYRKGKYINLVDTKNFAIKTDLLKSLRFKNELKNSEDFELSLRLRKIVNIRFLPEVRVNHHHRCYWLEWLSLNADRAYWVKIIYNMHGDDIMINQDPMFQSLHQGSLLRYCYLIIFEFWRQPFRKAWFIFLTGLAWRGGMFLTKLYDFEKSEKDIF